MFVSIGILLTIKHYDPKGCGIPLREWLIGFFVLYFSRSSFQMVKLWIVRNYPRIKFYYDVGAFIIANGSMAVWLFYGYDMFYSD